MIAGWQGPLPPPSILGAFDQQVQNGAERVFRQFELEAAHRRSMDLERVGLQKSQLGFIKSERRLSQWLAGIYAFGVLFLSFYALKEGYPATAGVIATTSIASVVAAFLTFGRTGVTSNKSDNKNDANRSGKDSPTAVRKTTRPRRG